ncbi:MAG: SPFH/Band 7/PHB domain protein [Ruminococcus sp.]|nr:SPFH/Band 7/PHB domain protein [Ruminococcus sp.]MBP8593887.1 SPFH/Band 7/PHB domain protein [Ruminococcus sp.]MBQ8123402.1 SPFH/Band 7/PHB domain protein [Ruminococcus sp.]HOO05487.1 SPFH domain-containing protein [Ruminococcus sp.]
MDKLAIIIAVVLIFLLIVFIRCIKIVPQAHVFVVERFGSFNSEWETGIHVLCPFIDRIAGKISLKEKVVDFKPQSVITKDNVTMKIDTVVFYQITNAKQYTYGVDHPLTAIENLSATTLRNIIGEMDLDSTLTSRDVINSKITAILDQATDRWGIKVNRVELKNILPPPEIQDAMEKQMKAERERREKILQAEGEKKSQILVAEGEKESQILRAEAKKQAQILEAQAEKEAMILRADAVKEQKILEATGEAQAIEMVQQAVAESLVKLNNANPSERVIQLKSLESFAKAADGKATKIIIPSEIQGIAGLAAGLKGIVGKDGQ